MSTPEPAAAVPNVRLCYFDNGSELRYYARDKSPQTGNTRCSQGRPGGKNLPNLYRDGARHDMTKCENFTQFLMRNDDHPDGFSGDVCEVMEWPLNADYSDDYSMDGMMDLCGNDGTCPD